MVLRNNKKKKPKQVENNNAEDKISSLPDELIHHILSFLPTKCRMSTCILSKRWNFVSNSMPILDFRDYWNNEFSSDERKQETKQFMDFLDMVLYHHEKPNIQKFYLNLDKFYNTSRVRKWISTIIRRKVEEFCLYMDHSSASSIFPLSFFTCDSLTLLDLHFCEYAPGEVNIPNTVCFPNLKILRLRCVNFLNEASNRKLFSNCPILEELRLGNCSMPEGLHVVNPALKHLFITYCFLTESTVEISAPDLMTISYKGDPPADFVIDSIPSLVEAVVDIDFDEEYCYMHEVFVKLYEKLSSAKHLKISADSFMVLKKADFLLTGSLTFNNLIELEICTQSRYISGLDSISKVKTLCKFLQLSPNLESILFAQSVGIPDEDSDGCWSLDPKGSLANLKSIKFKDFDGEPAELNAIKLFLKYAGFLETVTIVASPGLVEDQKKQLNVMKLLLKFPKPVNCVVDVLEQA